jgi:hypothetical protein
VSRVRNSLQKYKASFILGLDGFSEEAECERGAPSNL